MQTTIQRSTHSQWNSRLAVNQSMIEFNDGRGVREIPKKRVRQVRTIKPGQSSASQQIKAPPSPPHTDQISICIHPTLCQTLSGTGRALNVCALHIYIIQMAWPSHHHAQHRLRQIVDNANYFPI